MLSGLSVRNVVLIESLDLDFSRGLTALTGETGAGKSILLDALGMAAGARSDRGLVRAGTEKATTTASFALEATHPVWIFLDDHDLDGDASEDLRLKRVISSDGRSKAYVNDQPVGVKTLSQIGTLLLEVHGQHDGRGCAVWRGDQRLAGDDRLCESDARGRQLLEGRHHAGRSTALPADFADDGHDLPWIDAALA